MKLYTKSFFSHRGRYGFLKKTLLTTTPAHTKKHETCKGTGFYQLTIIGNRKIPKLKSQKIEKKYNDQSLCKIKVSPVIEDVFQSLHNTLSNNFSIELKANLQL